MRLLLILITISLATQVTGQPVQTGELSRRMDKGLLLMEAGEYQAAETEFIYVMDNMESLPSDMAYYFGRNSFHLNKYKQGINWLNKYIQLKGTQGRYYDMAVKYLQLSEDEYGKISKNQSKALQRELQGDDYDCGGLQKMLCPVCGYHQKRSIRQHL